MKITDLKIDGFGVWHDLTLRGMSPELTVFYGPNEAGKSTLMQFMRSILYGVSPTRRERYMPPVKGGRPGGWLKVETDHGPLTINRYADRGPTDVGKVTIITADGEEQGDRLLREALEHVDEPTYLNIFAVGLREVQELGSLSDTAAAQWLYRLTSGSGSHLALRCDPHARRHAPAAAELVGREVGASHARFAQRATARRTRRARGEGPSLGAIGGETARAGRRSRQRGRSRPKRLPHVPASWKSRSASSRSGSNAVKSTISSSVLPIFVRSTRARSTRSTISTNASRSTSANATFSKANAINFATKPSDLASTMLWCATACGSKHCSNNKTGCRRFSGLSTELADEVKHLEARLASENERLSHEWTGAGKIPPRITTDIVEQLTPQARAIEATEQMVATAKHELEIHRTGHDEYSSQIESAMTHGEKLGLPKDVEAAGDLVAQLRHRQQLEQKIAAAHDQVEELQAQAHDLVDDQVVSLELFIFLGTLFAGGFVALATWWFLPATVFGKYGGWIALAGIGGSIISFLVKFLHESSAFDRFDSCQYEIESALGQLEEAEAEQSRLDQELQLHGGSVALRLQHAERHLAELERIVPVESQRQEAAQEIDSAERRHKLAEEKYAAALTNWKARLRALGLPESVTPTNLATMAGQCERLADLEAKIENRRDDMQRRQREFAIVSQRIATLADETGLRLGNGCLGSSDSEPPEGTHAGGSAKARPQAPGKIVTPLEQLDHLRAEHQKHTQRVEQRDAIRGRARLTASNLSSTHTRRSDIVVVAKRCSKNAAWRTSRSCDNWPPSLTKRKTCGRSEPLSAAKSWPRSVATAPRPTSRHSWRTIRSAGSNKIGKLFPHNLKNLTAA